MTYRLTHDRAAAVAPDVHYLPMRSCPIAAKVILLGGGGVATVAQYDGKETFWRGWHPLPSVAKQQKQEATA